MYDYRGELTMYGKQYWTSSQRDDFPSTAWRQVFSKQTQSKDSMLARDTYAPPIWRDAPLRPIRAF
jgi:hypothetical protein